MDEKEFEELVKRCLSGQATEKEAALVDQWLNHRTEKDPFSRISESEKEEIGVKIFGDISSKIRGSGLIPGGKLNSNATSFYRAAAAIILLSALSYTIFLLTPHSATKEFKTVRSGSSPDAGKKVILGDGSIVWLKGNSSIQYPETFHGNERNVRLTGEGLFEVTRDPDHPFVIQCGGLIAKVLGTSFNIKSSETHIEVLVLTGKVALSSRGNSEGLILLPNEKAVYNEKQNQMAKVKAKENEKTAKTAGTEYSMRFHATVMKEIIRRIEGKFNVRVSLSDERLSNCTITADFTDQSLDRTLSMISQTLRIEYEIINDQVNLKGAGCDQNTKE